MCLRLSIVDQTTPTISTSRKCLLSLMKHGSFLIHKTYSSQKRNPYKEQVRAPQRLTGHQQKHSFHFSTTKWRIMCQFWKVWSPPSPEVCVEFLAGNQEQYQSLASRSKLPSPALATGWDLRIVDPANRFPETFLERRRCYWWQLLREACSLRYAYTFSFAGRPYWLVVGWKGWGCKPLWESQQRQVHFPFPGSDTEFFPHLLLLPFLTLGLSYIVTEG